MQLLFSFDQDTRVEKTLIQTLACQLSSTLMQLLFSFDQDTRVVKTLIQTLACQFSYKPLLVNSHAILVSLTFVLSEKELVLDMIRALSTSDYEFREGYQQAVRSPMYEDQLLQHESTLDIDAIREYNERHGRNSKKDHEIVNDERQGTPVEEVRKLR